MAGTVVATKLVPRAAREPRTNLAVIDDRVCAEQGVLEEFGGSVDSVPLLAELYEVGFDDPPPGASTARSDQSLAGRASACSVVALQLGLVRVQLYASRVVAAAVPPAVAGLGACGRGRAGPPVAELPDIGVAVRSVDRDRQVLLDRQSRLETRDGALRDGDQARSGRCPAGGSRSFGRGALGVVLGWASADRDGCCGGRRCGAHSGGRHG